ncbi:plasmid replication, integration and excision activator [Kribbella sp. NPDC050281]|uniref:plasmid replication, integration and excision activator n=1 Tax=Kribbella sp. NPDC050281 TaxID=3155515 RepID=UPI0033F682D2
MAMPRKINIQFGEVFPHGVYAVSEVTQVRDFDRSTKDRPVYSVDEDSGLNVWSVDVMDGDPEARKADRQLSIKILAKQQPVLPPSNGLPFTPVEFEGMTATPYVSDSNGRPRLAWSFRAMAVRAPKNASGANKPAA